LRIGEVTSACWSLSLERNIGFAMVPVAYAGLGTELVIETQAGMQDAIVVDKPFIDPGKDKPKRVVSAAL
jgi:glycine cleavage system aminomethyltransferase T